MIEILGREKEHVLTLTPSVSRRAPSPTPILDDGDSYLRGLDDGDTFAGMHRVRTNGYLAHIERRNDEPTNQQWGSSSSSANDPPPSSSLSSSTSSSPPPPTDNSSSSHATSPISTPGGMSLTPPPSTTTTSASVAPGSSNSGTASLSHSSTSLAGASSLSGSTTLLTTFTTSVPETITSGSSTFTTFSSTTITTARAADSSGTPSPFPFSNSLAANSRPVCLGNGIDISAVGLLETAILPSIVGLLIWLLFAFLRPRFRQIYAAREWFPRQDLRPEPLRDTFWAFLFPHVPFVPSVPSESEIEDAENTSALPSDSQLSQRVLYIAFRIVLGWSLIGLVGALPLYLINTPCLAQSAPPANFIGLYSTLQDLSVLRLLQLVENGDITTGNNLQRRLIVNGTDWAPNTRTRLIILTVFALVLVMLPALYKLLKEFTRLVKYRKRWLEVRCRGMEMGWLSAQQAPGFVGWGEKRLKDFIIKTGLSASLDRNAGIGMSGNMAGVGSGNRGQPPRQNSHARRQTSEQMGDDERADLDVDVASLFTIGDIGALADLIAERDVILNNLELSETRYIASFRLSTPEPSLMDPPPLPPKDEADIKRQISRPRALSGYTRRRVPRSRRQESSSTTTPTSYVAPSQYYKLRGVRGISGGRFSSILGGDSARPPPTTFTDSVRSRVVGSRFQEVNRDSEAYGRLPLGSSLEMTRGELGPVSPISDNGPSTTAGHEQQHMFIDPSFIQETDGETSPFGGSQVRSSRGPSDGEDDNVHSRFLSEEGTTSRYHESPDPASEFGTVRGGGGGNDANDYELNAEPRSDAVEFGLEEVGVRARQRRLPPVPSEKRETFPMRRQEVEKEEDHVPLHLRLQPRGPFVRPLSYLDHEDLGAVYNDIREYRAQLKQINAHIADAQNDCYNDIADGVRIKGWLISGRGIRFIRGIQMIEGRSKDDILWNELQHQGGLEKKVTFWSFVVVAAVFLALALIAVSGLALAAAPDVAHFLPFLQPLMNTDKIAGGLAITLVPVVLASIFFFLAILVIHRASRHSGDIAVTSARLTTYKASFFILTVVGTLWFIAVGAVIFALDAFSNGSGKPTAVANGAVYMSAFFLALVINVAIIAPGLLLLQPSRLRRVLWQERHAATPRQRFRAIYPRSYDPTYATACCILAVVLASTFSLIFPLIGPAIVLLLFLTIIAHRFLVGYVYGRVEAQTGGVLQIWLLRRFATVVTFQPILLGLLFLTRRLWIEGGVLIGVGFLCILLVEAYGAWKLRLPGRNSLSTVTQNSLDTFEERARPGGQRDTSEEGTSLVSSQQRTRPRGSMASVLEMMSLTLAVMPNPSQTRDAVPLDTESLDDLTATERAARTHPDAPPRLPDLSFTDHAEEMSGILYAPELIAPPPIIWLPNDSSGIARSEAYDLQRYHNLRTTLDVRSPSDVLPRRSSSRTRAVS